MIFYGWRIVAAAFVVLFTAYGAQYCFGVFFAALLDEFRWSRAGLSGVFSLYAFGYCVAGFPAGRLTDRWGPRAVVSAGAVFLGGALAAMALVRHLWQPYLIYGVIAALGMGTAYVPCHSTVVKWFARRRGLAIGVASTGASLGTFALPPLAQRAVTAAGWRAAYVVLGLCVFTALALSATVMRRDPRSLGLRPDGDDAAPAPPFDARPGRGFGLRRAMHARPFWLIAGGLYGHLAGGLHPARAPGPVRARPGVRRRHGRVARERWAPAPWVDGSSWARSPIGSAPCRAACWPCRG